MFPLRGSIKRRNALAAVWLIASLAGAVNAAAPEDPEKEPPRIAVVTHVENDTPSLTQAELARMFRKTQTEWPDGERCIPIDQVGGSEIRTEFGRIVLEETPDEWKRYWMRQTMTGNARPPVALDSSDTVKKYLQKLRGAVAYIYLSEVDDTVRILTITDAPELAAPDLPTEASPEAPADNDEGRADTPPEEDGAKADE